MSSLYPSAPDQRGQFPPPSQPQGSQPVAPGTPMTPGTPMAAGTSMASGAPMTGPAQHGPTPGGAPALEIDHLSKAFGPKQAVADLSLRVPAGCLFGLVGPNGAGKTTTLSMATGLLRPDTGRVAVWGQDVWTDPYDAKRLMGVLPDGLRLFDRLSGRELVMFVAKLRQVPEHEAHQRCEELLNALGLTPDANTLVADYSAGMTKKIGLACALIHNPRLLVLDEPMEAVDPLSQQTIRSILKHFVASGGTVVMSSHVMELVESLCDAVGVVAHGRILAVGTIADVCRGMRLQDRFVQLLGGPAPQQEGALSWLGR